jgi:hypothetical protein
MRGNDITPYPRVALDLLYLWEIEHHDEGEHAECRDNKGKDVAEDKVGVKEKDLYGGAMARWRSAPWKSCKRGPAILILSNLARERDHEASLEAQATLAKKDTAVKQVMHARIVTALRAAGKVKNDEERDRILGATSKYCAKPKDNEGDDALNALFNPSPTVHVVRTHRRPRNSQARPHLARRQYPYLCNTSNVPATSTSMKPATALRDCIYIPTGVRVRTWPFPHLIHRCQRLRMPARVGKDKGEGGSPVRGPRGGRTGESGEHLWSSRRN